MNKTELVTALSEKANVSKKDAEAVLKAFTETVASEIKKGESIQLVGFGTFGRKVQNERVSFGKKYPAKYAPSFKFGKSIKDEVATVKVK